MKGDYVGFAFGFVEELGDAASYKGVGDAVEAIVAEFIRLGDFLLRVSTRKEKSYGQI